MGQEHAPRFHPRLEIYVMSPSQVSIPISCEDLNHHSYLQVKAKFSKKKKSLKNEKCIKKNTLKHKQSIYNTIIHRNTINTIQSKLTIKVYDENPIVLTTIIIIKDNYKNPNYKYSIRVWVCVYIEKESYLKNSTCKRELSRSP